MQMKGDVVAGTSWKMQPCNVPLRAVRLVVLDETAADADVAAAARERILLNQPMVMPAWVDDLRRPRLRAGPQPIAT